MSHNITANTIRKAGLEVRLPLVAQLLREAHQQAGTVKGTSCRLAARYLVGNIVSPEYDIMARLQILEGASGKVSTGPNAGTWWKKGRRGLKAAAEFYKGTDIDPSWLSEGNTGMISRISHMVHAMYQKLSDSEGSFTSPDDILQNSIMGLTKGGTPASYGPMFLHFGVKSSSIHNRIVSGDRKSVV